MGTYLLTLVFWLVEGFYYSPYAFLTIRRTLLTQIDYHLDMTDAIFLPLTRAWGGEGYDEAVGEAES